MSPEFLPEFAFGAPNIPKRAVKNKRGTRLLAAGVLAALAAASGAAQRASAITASIAWQVPMRADDRFVLEIAKDPDFGETVLEQEVTGSGFIWEAPEEAVYHWRLRRGGLTGARQPGAGEDGLIVPGVEGSTFVSGSFAVVAGGTERQSPARLTWEPEPGADHYKLYVVDAGTLGASAPGTFPTPRVMTTATPSFVVPASERDLMIEVVPYSGTQRTFRYYHFNPTLRLDTGVPPPPAPVAPVPPVPEPAPVAAEPVPEPAPEPEAIVVEAAAPARRRVHLVSLFALAGEEELELQKLDADLKARDRTTGGGAQVWVNPWAGLVVQAQGTYHEHVAKLEQPETAQTNGHTEPYEMRAARWTTDVAVGWDLLHGLDLGGSRLPLSLVGATAQLPHLPLDLDPSEALKVQNRQISLIGASLGYGWFGERGAVTLDGGALSEKTDDARLTFARLQVELYPTERLAILFGGLTRQTAMTRCHPDDRVCLAQGKVKTTAQETAGFLGIGAVFR
jgi:hypothetical protein